MQQFFLHVDEVWECKQNIENLFPSGIFRSPSYLDIVDFRHFSFFQFIEILKLINLTLLLDALLTLNLNNKVLVKFEKFSLENDDLSSIWIPEGVRSVYMFIDLIHDLERWYHLVEFSVGDGFEDRNFRAAAALLQAGLNVENLMYGTGGSADFIFLFSHGLSLHVFVVDALNHKLESFGRVCLTVQGEEVRLVGYLEKLSAQLGDIEHGVVLAGEDLLEESLHLLRKLSLRCLGSLGEIEVAKLLHLLPEGFQVPEHLHDHVEEAVEDALRIGQAKLFHRQHFLGALERVNPLVLHFFSDWHRLRRVY